MWIWINRLDSFKELKTGWDSYRAEPPNALSTVHARCFLTFLMGIDREPTKLNPSVVGGIGFTFRKGNKSVYVEFRNTGSCHAALFGDGEVMVDSVGQNNEGFKELIGKIDSYLTGD